MKKIWSFLGDTRVAFVLLMGASGTLIVGSFYAQKHFSLFRELNRMRVQDWLQRHWTEQPELIWWVPVLFAIMTGLGLNTIICVLNRVARLVRQRDAHTRKRFFYLLTPSLIHFLFIFIMLGHLITFTLGMWQVFPLNSGAQVVIDQQNSIYRVGAIKDRFYPGHTAMRDRIAQTTVILTDGSQNAVRLRYLRPVLLDGRFLLLDKVKKNKKATEVINSNPTAGETCNKAHVYKEPDKKLKTGSQRLLIVTDPGCAVIVTGLTLIMGLMIAYFIFQPGNSSHLRLQGRCHSDTQGTELHRED